jgi:hypothetical protein
MGGKAVKCELCAASVPTSALRVDYMAVVRLHSAHRSNVAITSWSLGLDAHADRFPNRP